MRLQKVYSIVLLLLTVSSFGQTDTSKKTTGRTLKSYKEVITEKAVSRKGVFTVHTIDDKYFFEIAEGLLQKEMLLVTRLSKSAASLRAGMIGYAGDDVNEAVVRFEKGPAGKLFVRKVYYNEHPGDSTQPMFKAVSNSNVQPIAAAFDIKTIHPDTKAMVIDVTDLLNGDNDLLFFATWAKAQLKLGVYQSDKSYISSVNAFPVNTEIRAVKTYLGAAQMGLPPSQSFTVELNTSIVLLPAQPMQSRYADGRVGFFEVGYTDFDANPQGTKKIKMIKRWRLEPREEDRDKYFNGQLVEPKKPIVFYIDPATPEKWVPYLIQGVNDWQVAFEQAGFKNAIYARRAPSKQEDSTWSLDDARYSAIVYKPSDVPNASGPSIADPRSGEILESHINWYHNVMKLVHDWYFVQAAAIDPNARSMQFEDSLMGQLIRFVSSHEVGHTLGLLHNFGASSTVPVDSLRSRSWLQKYGHTPSIMDYARFNYVAQPEDHITEKEIFPRINDYDKWAIEWGYRLFPGITKPADEAGLLNKWIIDSLQHNKRLWYGPQMILGSVDPRSQYEDLGDDAMKAGAYGVKNLQRIVQQLPGWTKVPNEGYGNLTEMYDQVLKQFSLYASHVINNVGGFYLETKTVEEPGNVTMPVPPAKQKAAMTWLQQYLFTTPEWLRSPAIMSKMELQMPPLNKQAVVLLQNLLRHIGMVMLASRTHGENRSYTVQAFLQDMQKSIWTELSTHAPIDDYRRDLQNAYTEQLTQIIKPPTATEGKSVSGLTYDVQAIVKVHLENLRKSIATALPVTNDTMSKIHLQYVLDRINKTLRPAPGV